MINTMHRYVFFPLFVFLAYSVVPATAFAQEATIPTDEAPIITSVSTNFISIPSDQPFQKKIALYGEHLDAILFNEQVFVSFGSAKADSVAGNATGITATFTLDPGQFRHNTEYLLEIYQDNFLIAEAPEPIIVAAPLQRRYRSKRIQKLLTYTNTQIPSKQTIGLNVHHALGATQPAEEELFEQRLSGSDTVWVREHLSYAEIMGENQVGWLERYDEAFLQYKRDGRRVVAMLAYGAGTDPYAPPSESDWKVFVELIVQRYRNDVDAWEIWNEPDSKNYLHPNTVTALLPLQKVGYETIKAHAPDSIVLNGPIADIRHTDFVRELYKNAGSYFDRLSVHLYYCDEYVRDGNVGAMENDWNALMQAIPKKRRGEKIWITELGCSLGVRGVDEKVQRAYIKQSTRALLKTDHVQTIFLYTIRDRAFLTQSDPYEAYFGLLHADGGKRPAWRWYSRLPLIVLPKQLKGGVSVGTI